uniref:Hsr-9 Tudor domain-containing protein n=1 Tax=Clastoptera arizonana TaxID=38151 RepID=A0A1B6DCL8_9HEMI
MEGKDTNPKDGEKKSSEKDDPDSIFNVETEVIGELENQITERYSQDTYCSLDSQIGRTESLNEEDEPQHILSASEKITEDTTVDMAEMCKLSQQMDSSLEVELGDKSVSIAEISVNADKEIIGKENSIIVLNSSTDTEKDISLNKDNSLENLNTSKKEIKIKGLDSPDMFSEKVFQHEPMDVSPIDESPKNCSIFIIPDSSGESKKLEAKCLKRKAETKSKDETPPKKSRSSCMVIYEGTPKRHQPLATLDLTEEHSHEEVMVLDDTQNDFSLRLDSPNGKSFGSQDLQQSWKSHIKSNSENVTVTCNSSTEDKECNVSWQSHKELTEQEVTEWKHKYEKVLKERDELQEKLDQLLSKNIDENKLKDKSPVSNDSKESLYSYLEKRFMCGVILFTINEATNQFVSAEVKQLSLVDNDAKDKKQRSSVSSGYLADKSFSSGTSGESGVSIPGRYNLPLNRHSILSTTSSSSHASATSVLSSASAYTRSTDLRNWDGPFLIPSAPIIKNLKNNLNYPLSGSGFPFPPVENLDEFLNGYPMVNGSPEIEKNGVVTTIENTATEDIIKEPQIEGKQKECETESSKETVDLAPQKKVRGKTRNNNTATKQKKATSQKGVPVVGSKTPVLSQVDEEDDDQVKCEGKAVFAKWSDSHYYPGWVNEDMSAPRVKVNFYDGNVTPLATVKIIPANWLKEGKMALAQQKANKNKYSPCIVMEVVELERNKGPIFTVDVDSSISTLEFSQVALTENQVAELREEAIATGRLASHHLVSLDNVVSHPRTRTSRTPSQTTTPKTPKGTNTPSRKRAAKPEPEPGTSNTSNSIKSLAFMSGSTSDESSLAESIKGNERLALDPECSPQEFPSESKRKTSQKKQVKSTAKNSKRVLDEDFIMEQRHGPFPNEGSELFMGFNFLITYTDKKVWYHMARKGDSFSSDMAEFSTDGEGFDIKSFNKQRLRNQIKNGGGKLYRTLHQVPVQEYSRTYLITDAPSCTPLYLECLVHGITIHNHETIIVCCKENRPFKEVIENRSPLPAGFSVEKTVYRKQQKSVKPFKKLKGNILLALSLNKACVQFWNKLLTAAGAKVVVHNDKAINLSRISVIVTDFNCKEDLIDEANHNKISLVSLVWVEQCIIDGMMRPYQGHEYYNYKYVTPCESPEL